jgi:hypothetical protein
MMVELGRYRRERGLPVLPAPREATPLVLPLGKAMKPITRAALHTIIKDIFAGAAANLRLRGEDYAAPAAQLECGFAYRQRQRRLPHDARQPRARVGHDDQPVRARRRRPTAFRCSMLSTADKKHIDDPVFGRLPGLPQCAPTIRRAFKITGISTIFPSTATTAPAYASTARSTRSAQACSAAVHA